MKQLAVFDAVADTGSVSVAAEKTGFNSVHNKYVISNTAGENAWSPRSLNVKVNRWLLTQLGMWLRPKAKRLFTKMLSRLKWAFLRSTIGQR